MNKSLLQLATFFLIFTACEEQPIPVPPAPEIAEGRVMLIEEMTGVQCSPCFDASVILNSMLDTFSGSIVAYAVHGELQTDPLDGSKYDFRIPAAVDIQRELDSGGKPSAAFNRTVVDEVSGNILKLTPNTWQSFVERELQKQQVAEIRILSTYNEESRQVEIDVSVIPIEDILGEIFLHVKISESHLIDPQSSLVGRVDDFEHNHVLKASTTASQGDLLVTDAIADEDYRKKYFYSLPDEVNGEWIAENMEITAFVSAKDRNGEVQQAAQIHLTE